jgi:hypothetical protein
MEVTFELTNSNNVVYAFEIVNLPHRLFKTNEKTDNEDKFLTTDLPKNTLQAGEQFRFKKKIYGVEGKSLLVLTASPFNFNEFQSSFLFDQDKNYDLKIKEGDLIIWNLLDEPQIRSSEKQISFCAESESVKKYEDLMVAHEEEPCTSCTDCALLAYWLCVGNEEMAVVYQRKLKNTPSQAPIVCEELL